MLFRSDDFSLQFFVPMYTELLLGMDFDRFSNFRNASEGGAMANVLHQLQSFSLIQRTVHSILSTLIKEFEYFYYRSAPAAFFAQGSLNVKFHLLVRFWIRARI